jgi:hypothetical protein
MGEEGAGKLGFLDSLGRLFRAKEEAEGAKEEARAPQPQAAGGFAKLEADFEAVIRGLREKLVERDTGGERPGAAALPSRAEDRAAERLRRMEACHRAIREDIEEMHARLGTGLAPADLEAITAFLKDLDTVSTTGKDSHELLPRLRYAIATRLRAEAGELSVARIVALLERSKLSWPDPTHYRPSATPDEIDRSRRRRLAEVRESFLAHDAKRTAERMLGIVRAWGGDYPDRGSPLWEESVLEGVAAGIRGQLLKEFVEVLRRDRELLLTRTEASIGKELAALQKAMESGVRSIEEANLAVATSLHALDEVVPEIAWERVRSQLPQARGEFA